MNNRYEELLPVLFIAGPFYVIIAGGFIFYTLEWLWETLTNRWKRGKIPTSPND